MDRFEEMRTFVSVVELGSISATAERFVIAKSAISRRLAELENRLGVQLLNRTTRRITLTEGGQQYYQHCRRILADVDETEQIISSEQAQLKGTIRLAAPLSFGLKHLSPVINHFLTTHEDVKLELDLNDRLVNLLEEGIDLAIRIGRLQDSSYKAKYLAPIKSIVCASPDYLKRYGIPKTPADLKKHVALNYSNVPETELWRFESEVPVSINVPHRMRVNNGEFLLQAAIEGLGIITSPSFIAYEAVKQGLLQPILQNFSLPDIGLYAIYPEQRYLPKRVRVLIDYLAEQFGDKPYWDKF